MKKNDIDDFERADRAVSFADQDVRNALQVLGQDGPPRLAQFGIAAVAVGVVGALVMRRGRRRGSRLSKAIDYSVLLPLAANLIPRIVSAVSASRANRAYVSGRMR